MAIKLKFKNPLAKKARKGFRGYPVGTIAYYGPDNKKATKVVASIVESEDAEPSFMKKWHSENEIRRDINVLNEIKEFLSEHNAISVVLADKIIGCPHQEGIDYPDGEQCPDCPFWKNRDRFTGEIIH